MSLYPVRVWLNLCFLVFAASTGLAIENPAVDKRDVQELCPFDKIPASDQLRKVMAEAYHLYRSDNHGTPLAYTADVPKVDPSLFGIAIVTVNGDVYEIGDSKAPFAIQSISKPFVFGLALEDHGHTELLNKVGVEPTGMHFNSLLAIEVNPAHKQNPSVNAGAIATVSLIKGKDNEVRLRRILDMFKKYTGRTLQIDQRVLASEVAQSGTNRALASRMDSLGLMYGDVDEAVDLYLKNCSLTITAYDLALMGAALANAGTNPITKEAALQEKYVRYVLSVMVLDGLYEYSGQWFYAIGIPAKSGVGGGIVAVVPGKFGIGIFSPPLDTNGNSVRGIETSLYLSNALRLPILEPRLLHGADKVPSIVNESNR